MAPAHLARHRRPHLAWAALAVCSALMLVGCSDTTHSESSGDPAIPADLVTARDVVTFLRSEVSSTVEFDDVLPMFKPAGYAFWVEPATSWSLTISGTAETVAADVAMLGVAFLESGYARTVIEAASSGVDVIVAYENDAVRCLLRDRGTTYGSDHSATLGCIDTVDLVADAEAIAPFFDAYATIADFSADGDYAMQSPVIEPSQTPGYRLAMVATASVVTGEVVGGYGAFFYETPDGVWHFFKAAQSIWGCEEFTTTDLKLAYAGVNCFDRGLGDVSTVQP